jgi:hypothetical protein
MSKQDTLKKVFVITPRFGLCNQLSSIAKGILYAHIYGRDVYFDGFQNDYRHANLLSSFDSIFDIEKINEKLAQMNINVKIVSNIPPEKIQQIDTEDIPDNARLCHLKNIIPILNLDKYREADYLCLENPISSVLPEAYLLLEHNVNRHIYFHPAFYDKVKQIKERLNLNDYCCIHMRLEDDAIDYMTLFSDMSFSTINDIFIQKYIVELERLRIFKYKIYVCTSLGVQENKNNALYTALKEKYELVDKRDIPEIDDILSFDANSRELHAIIDLIIGMESNYFIGCDWSSFSSYILFKHIDNEKYYKNLNLYSDIKKVI